jgi:uncharacterized membrane protein YgdD (TMEM256/DUF423 family)
MNWILVSSVSGFLGVALGAFGAHGLKDRLDAYALGVWQTAVQYQVWHALALFGVGLLLRLPGGGDARFANQAGWGFFLGTFVFSGSLYLLAFSGVKTFGAITPLGGVAFLFGWFALARLALKL